MNRIETGVAYYPEDWNNDRVRYDAELMQAAGVRYVRMAEFAWSHIEPREGEYSFQWLHDAVNIFGEYGIRTVLCTPSSAAPAWMCKKYPEILRVQRWGERRAWFGVRDHTCYTSKKYREFCVSIARKMAQEFRDDPNVAAWQIDNEAGCSRFPDCFCPECQAAFLEFLKGRYSSLDELNRAWGATFWSGEFSEWDEIELENRMETMMSTRTLESRRFRSAVQASFVLEQAAAIREVIPGAQIGTNNYALADRYQVFEGLDYAGADLYPWAPEEDNRYLLFEADVYRGLKPGKTPWVMETHTAPGWPRYDLMGLYFWTFVAHGYNQIFYFHWNRHLGGNEKQHPCILSVSGKPEAKYAQFKALVAESSKPVFQDLPLNAPQAAILFDYDNTWVYAIGVESIFEFHEKFIMENYLKLRAQGIEVDMVSPEMDFNRYRLLVLPIQAHISDKLGEKLKSFVRNGGVLVMNGSSGTLDYYGKNLTFDGPENLQELFGLTIRENQNFLNDRHRANNLPLYDDSPEFAEKCPVVSGEVDGKKMRGTTDQWTCYLELDGAEVLMRYENSVLTGHPFLTKNRYGEGYAIYYAADAVDSALLGDILKYSAKLSGARRCELPANVDVAQRGDLLFVANFNRHAIKVNIGDFTQNLLGPAPEGNTITLNGYENAVLKR